MPHSLYTFFLSFIQILLFASVFGYMLALILKLYFRALRAGLEDEQIKAEYKHSADKASRASALYTRIISFALGVILLSVFAFSVFVNLSENVFFEKLPTPKLIKSGSMSEVNEKNSYLAENALDDQIPTLSLVLLYSAPSEDALELYDIVLYKSGDKYILHRIIAIEEPNASHPDGRRFILRGDANAVSDSPVDYSQIKAIYKGEKLVFLGSFISFLQSPIGYVCTLLALFVCFALPLIEKKLADEKKARLAAIGYIDGDGKIIDSEMRD